MANKRTVEDIFKQNKETKKVFDPINEAVSIVRKGNSAERPDRNVEAIFAENRGERYLGMKERVMENQQPVIPKAYTSNRMAEESLKADRHTSRIEARTTEKPKTEIIDRKAPKPAKLNYDKGFVEDSAVDRLKLKYKLGQLTDEEGRAWSDAINTKDDRSARAKSAEIEALIKQYPWIQNEPEAKTWLQKTGRFIAGAGEAVAEMAPTMINAQISGAKTGLPSALGGAATAALLGQAGPQLAAPEEILTVPAGALAGYKVGSTFGTAEHMFNVERGLSYKSMIQDGLSPDVAALWSNIVGAANAGIEVVQLGTLAKSVKGLDVAIKSVKNAPVGKYLTKVGQTQLGKFGIGVATETAQEVGQEAVSILGQSGANVQSGRDAKLFTQDNYKRLVDTAIQSAKAFGVMQGAGQIAGGTYRAAFNQSKKDVISAVNEFNNSIEFANSPEGVQTLLALEEQIRETAETTGEQFFIDALDKVEKIKYKLAGVEDVPRLRSTVGSNETSNVDTLGADNKKVAQNANESVSERYRPREPKVISARFTEQEAPIPKSKPIGEFSNGDKVNTTKYGPVTVVDAKDSAFIKVKNQYGTELTIGRKALIDMTEQAIETPENKQPSSFLEQDEIEALLGMSEHVESIENEATPTEVKTPKPSPQMPKSFQRYEEPGIETSISDAQNKPQGLYLSDGNIDSPHKSLGGNKKTYDLNPDAKILEIETDMTVSNRGPVVGESGGIAVAKQFLGNEVVERMMRSTKGVLYTELSRRYPNVDWKKYNDQHEMVEAVGGILARENGYDGIWAYDKKDANDSTNEFIALTDKAIKEQGKEKTNLSQKTFYHGTGTKGLSIGNLDPFKTKVEGLFGSGVYLTDNKDIANGYSVSRGKKTNTPTMYEVKIGDVNLIDLEKPLESDVLKVYESFAKGIDVVARDESAIDVFNQNKSKTGFDLYRALTDEMSDLEIPTSEAVELITDLAVDLKELGYDGYTHVGGKLTNNKPHTVVILFDPSDSYNTGKKSNIVSFRDVTSTQSDKSETNNQSVNIITTRKDGRGHELMTKWYDAIRKGERVSLSDFKSAMKELVTYPLLFKQDLSKNFKIEELKKMVKFMHGYPADNKAGWVDRVYDDFISGFMSMLRDNTGTYMESYSYDGGKSVSQQKTERFNALLDSLTDEKFNELLARNAEQHIKNKEEAKRKVEGIKNPETIEDYERAMRVRYLTPEEKRAYEDLKALAIKERNDSKQDQSKVKEIKAAAEIIDGKTEFTELTQSKNTKTNETIFEFTLADRVEKDTWSDVLSQVKKLGGGYWKGKFYFTVDTIEEAQSLMDTLKNGGKLEKTSKEVDTPSKLRTVADNMQTAIDNAYGDRKENTAKRAAQASSAREQGDHLKRIQAILNKIADALETNNLVYLSKIDSRAHIETLNGVMAHAKRPYVDAVVKKEFTDTNSYAAQMRHKELRGQKANIETIDYATMPSFGKGTLQRVIESAIKKDGMVREGEKLLRRLQSIDDLNYTKSKEFIDYIERAIKKGVSADYAENQLGEMKRLERMGINSDLQLRAALREYLPFYNSEGATAEELRMREVRARELKLTRTKIEGFFPTPKRIVSRMIELANIQNGDKILEPSAGSGHIADEIGVGKIDVVEYDRDLNQLLKDKGHNVIANDVFKAVGQYDKIIMNPPFERLQDIDHVRHVYDNLLKPNGRIVAIMSESPFFRETKKAEEFREWLDEVGYSEKLPEGSFKDGDRSTGVATRLVVIDKPDVVKSEVVKDLENIGWAEKDGLKLKIVMSDGKTYDIEASTKAPGVGSYREFIAREYETWEDAANNVERILSSKSLIQDGIKEITPRSVAEKPVVKAIVKETKKPVDPNADPYAGIDAEKAEVYKNLFTAKAYEKRTPPPTKVAKNKNAMNIVNDTYGGNGHWLVEKRFIKKGVEGQLLKLDRQTEMADDKLKPMMDLQKNYRDREIAFELIGFNDTYVALKDTATEIVVAIDKDYYDYFASQGLKFKQFGEVSKTNPIGMYEGDNIVGLVLPVRAVVAGMKASDIVNLENNYPSVVEESNSGLNLTGFKNKEIDVNTSDGPKKVKALTFGNFAYHNGTLTFIPEGLAITTFVNNQSNGKMLIKYLDAYFGQSTSKDDLVSFLNSDKLWRDLTFMSQDQILKGSGGTEWNAEKWKEFVDKSNSNKRSKSDAYAPWSTDGSIRNQYKSKGNTKLKPVHEIMNDIKRSFKVGITNSRYRNNKAYAHYKSFPQVIESKIVNTIEPLMHELGHHFDYRYNLNAYESVAAMIEKMPAEFKQNYTKDKHPREAIAEFVRLYTTSPDDAKVFGEDFYEEFESALSADDLKNLQRIRTDVLNWLDGAIQDQIKSTMVSRTSKPNFESVKSRIVDNWNMARKKIYMFLWSELEPLKDFARFIEKTTGEKLDTSKDPYALAMYSLKSSTIARSIIIDGLQDTNSDVVGVSFQEIIKDITVSDYDDFNAYLIAKRALDYHGRGKRTFSDDLPISYIENVVEEYERTNPVLKDTADKLYAWWQRFTEAWIVETGLLEKSAYEYMKELEPHYVPFFRMRQEQTVIGDAVMQLSRRGYADQRNPIKRSSRDGSSDPIYYPIESILAEIERYVTTVNRREVMLAIHEVYNELSEKGDVTSGIGSIINKVNPRMDVDSVNMKDYKLKLTLKLYEEFAQTLSTDERLEFETLKKDAMEARITFEEMLEYLHKKGFNAMSIVNEVIDDTMLEFKPMDFDKEKNILTVKDRNGKTIHYEVYDRFLLEALLNNDTSNIDTATRIVSSIRRVVQTLTTSWNAVFIAKNIVKDTGQGFVASNIPMHKYHIELAKAVGDMLKNDEWAKKYRMAGGGFSGMIGSDSNALQATLADVVPGWKKKHIVRTALLALERFSDAIEQAPRLAEFKNVVKTKGNSKSSIVEAIQAAQDVTVNFNRKGQIMRRWYGQLVPFLNPALQGLDKTVRMHSKENISKTVVRALVGITLVKLLAYAMNKDDEDYKKANKFIKDTNIMLNTGNGQFIRIPMAHGLGVLYGSGFERALDAIIEQNPDAWEGFSESLVSAFMPPTESITKALSDAKSNKTWYGGNIVPYDLQKIEVDQQFNDKTSWIAKQIAKIVPDKTNLSSPMVIDYLIDQYTGAAGKVVTGKYLEYAARSFTSDVAYSNSVISKFYDRSKMLETAKATDKKERQVKNEKLINPALYDLYNDTADRISNLNKLHDQIPNMSDVMFNQLISELESGTVSRKEAQRLLKLLAVESALKANLLYDGVMKGE